MAETKPKPKIKRRKPKALRKEESIRIRVSDEQKDTLTAAATRAGLGVSPWLLMLGLREAKKTDEGDG